ncbi:MAG: hypothetical protein IKJ81_10925 [Bacteroidales bacterium]|jgi:hypothetical protein|nr:hypothetical protein [Bacteroidales bacterium]
MKKKKSTKKAKKVIVTLSARDYDKLTLLAQKQNVSRPLVAKRLLRAQLSTLALEKQQKQSENQLGLFDSMQIDIFNGTSKTV